MAVLLSDDLLPEIVLHIKDAADLFQGATVCKQWHNLVAMLLARGHMPLVLRRWLLHPRTLSKRGCEAFSHLGALPHPGTAISFGPAVAISRLLRDESLLHLRRSAKQAGPIL